MTSIRLGLIGDEPGISSLLSAYLNTPFGSGPEVFVKKSILIDGEQQVLEISSCQWQADTWLEIKNQVIKYSEGFMFICRPAGNAMKLRTIRKIINSVLKVRGKVPMVVVSNELTSDATSSFDENLIHLQTLFSALRCPILRTTTNKNERMLGIMFADLTKFIKKHDYSTDPKGAYMTEFESTLIRETDTHDDFFGVPPTPIIQEQVVPQWGSDHQSARSVLFGSSTSPSPSSPSFLSPNLSASPSLSLSLSPNLSSSPSPSRSPSPTPPSLSTVASSPHISAPAFSSSPTTFRRTTSLPHPKPEVPSPNLSPNMGPPGPNLSTSPNRSAFYNSPRKNDTLHRNSEVHKDLRVRTDSQFRLEPMDPVRTASPTRTEFHREGSKSEINVERKLPDTITHLHEKMAATLVKSDKLTAEKPDRLLHYSDINIPATRIAEGRSGELQFRHPNEKGAEENGSPWDDNSNSTIRTSQKTRRETTGRNPRPRKFPPVSPPITPPLTPTEQPLTEDVFEDILPPDVKIQRAHLQQQIIARKAFLPLP
jgi:hypothetical protein